MIKKINELLMSKLTNEKTIYVLKGFNSIFDQLQISIEHVFNLDLPNNLLKLGDCSTELLKSGLENLIENKPLFCLYEEMLLVVKNNLFGIISAKQYNVSVLDIGIFNNFYPGFLNMDNNKIVDLFEEDIDNKNNNILQDLYSSCLNENNHLIVSYNEIDEEFIKKFDSLFSSHSIGLTNYNLPTTTIIDLFDNSTPQNLVCVFNDIAQNKYNTINYTNIESNQATTNFKFVSCLNSLGINVQLDKIQIFKQLPTLYNEYLKILHRKNPSFDFLDIDMYKDPFNSNELEKVNQSIIIDTIYQNILKAQRGENPRDIFVTAPTGAGKSILFQIPAIVAAEKENLITIVISPLIGLMNDQVQNIKSMTKCAATINSEFTPFEKEEIKEKIKAGEISILYISPETLLSNSDIKTFIGDRKIGLLVIDEAHTVATWGKNFRPDYWYLGDYLNKLRHSSEYIFPIATFTATATIGSGDDMYHDIIDSLNMTPIPFIGNVKRNNIIFDIKVYKKDHAYAEEKDNQVIDSINKYLDKNEKTLVYFPYVTKLNDIYNHLGGKNIGKYYGGLDKIDKKDAIENIRIGSSNVIFATKAFGMGIDIPDIKNVYHFAPTGNLADYVQEIGRAARKPNMIGIASTDFYREDFRYINKLYGLSQITVYNIIGVLQKILYKYRTCKNRNFMMSTEEFAHVFVASDDEEIENKLKATVLAIKKDFIKISHYVPLIFKPRSMFTKGLFFIPDSKLEYIKKIGWNKYLTKRYDRDELKKMTSGGLSYEYIGDVYEFDFKQCWEEKYNKLYNGLSFGAFKRNFYDNQLGIDKSAFLDRMILTVESKYNKSFNDIQTKIIFNLEKIKEALDDIKISNKHFTIEDFAIKVCDKLNNYISPRKMADILEPLLNILISVDRNSTFGNTKFCEYNSQTNKYRIVSSFYNRLIVNLKNEIKAFFTNFQNEKQRIAIIDTQKDSKKKMRKNMLLVAVQIMELFDLISYNLKNGDCPEFFIRVNSEKAILKVLENKDYHSQTLDTIRNLHYSSVDYMTYFFENLKTDKERWDFIEDYFLGVDIYNKYNIPHNKKIKIKVIDEAHQEEIFHENIDVSIKKTIKIYTISGDVNGKFYISNKKLDFSNDIRRLSTDSEVAKCLILCDIGDVFKVNQFEYLVENIVLQEI